MSSCAWRVARFVWLATLFALLGLAATWARAEVPVPALRARVTDQTGTLDAARLAALEERLKQFEATKGSQIGVLIVPTTQPESIEQYALRVAETWKLGRKGVDDGILLLVAKDDRAVRIEVGYGLEGAVSDIHAMRIIQDEMLPRFRQGDFAAGIDAAVGRLIGLVNGEALPEPATLTAGDSMGGFIDQFLPMVLLFAFVGGGILRAMFGRFLGASLAGGLGFFGAWWLLDVFGIALAFGLIVFIVTLVSGGGGWSSGGGGGWSSGGGGFSGGGGGFGGGGASGRW
jgi:uncharacterized protein